MTEPQRRADWFELFFDLVFVVTVSVLAHGLHGHPGWGEFGTFFALFFPAWWAWVNLMVTVNLFPGTRAWEILLLAMPGLALMAASVPEGLGSRAWTFALGAAWVRLGVFALWLGHSRSSTTTVSNWRPYAYNLFPAAIWALSVLVPSPWRYVMWAAGIGIEMLLLAWQSGQRQELYGRFAIDHLVERIGLFLVIVLGEGVFGVVTQLAGHFGGASAVAALGGLIASSMMAIGFFRWGSVRAEHGLLAARSRGAGGAMRDAVMYLPFFLVSSVAVLAAALAEAVAEPGHTLPLGHRIGLAGGIAGYYLFTAAIGWRIGGDATRDLLRWLPPALLLPLAVVLPLTFVVPAWAATLLAAAATGTVVGLGKINDRRVARKAAAAFD